MSNLRVNSITPSLGTNVAIGTAGGTITYNSTISGISTFSSGIVANVTGNVTGNLTGNVNASGVSTFSSGIVVAAGSAAAPSISPTGDSDTGIFFPSADTIAFGEGGSEAARIDSSGRLGIGSNAPQHLCQIAGTLAVDSYNDTTKTITLRPGFEANANGGMGLVAKDHSGSAPDGLGIYGTDGVSVHTANAGTFFERFRVDTSGRLLVGTSSARTNIYSGANNLTPPVQFETATASYSSGLSLINYSSDGYPASLTLGVSLSATQGTNTLVRINEMLGRISFNGNDGTNFRSAALIEALVDGFPGSGDMPGRLIFSTTADGASTPTERLRLTSGGLFQSMPIYDTTGGNAPNVVVNSNGTVFRSTSSAKYKTDIETLQDQYADAVLGLRPVWYRSKCEIDNPEWSYWGFIAEEVAEIDPRLVSWKTTETSYDEQGAVVQTPLETPEPEGVQYDRFVPHLLNLIKRQKEQIEAMEARLSALESA